MWFWVSYGFDDPGGGRYGLKWFTSVGDEGLKWHRPFTVGIHLHLQKYIFFWSNKEYTDFCFASFGCYTAWSFVIAVLCPHCKHLCFPWPIHLSNERNYPCTEICRSAFGFLSLALTIVLNNQGPRVVFWIKCLTFICKWWWKMYFVSKGLWSVCRCMNKPGTYLWWRDLRVPCTKEQPDTHS